MDLIIEIPSNLPDDLLAQAVAESIEAAVAFNTAWYLAEFEAGRDPPCCAKCAGARYVPSKPGMQWRVATAPVLLERMVASCESIAAMHTGHKRADSIKQGSTWAAARAAYQIALEDTGTPRYWHVVSYDLGKRHDATEGMAR